MAIGILIGLGIEAGIAAQYLSGWGLVDAFAFWLVLLSA